MTIFITDNITHDLNIEQFPNDKTLFLDMSAESFLDAIARKQYDSIKIIPSKEIIKILFDDGTIFYSQESTLKKSNFFTDIMFFGGENKEFIVPNLDPKSFVPVLSWLRDPLYPIIEANYDAMVYYGCVGDNVASFMDFYDEVQTNNRRSKIELDSEDQTTKNNLFNESFKQHTNFFLGNNLVRSKSNKDGSYYCTLKRLSDLIFGLYLIIEPKYSWQKCQDSDITEIILEGGGSELVSKTGHAIVTDLEINIPEFQPIHHMYKSKNILYFPLNFSLTQQYLPLIATRYHKIRVIVNTINRIEYTIRTGYRVIYLDMDERRRFAQVSHEYLTNDFNANSFKCYKSMVRFSLDLVSVSALIIKTPNPDLVWAKIFSDGELVAYTDKPTSNYDFQKLGYGDVPNNYYIIPFCFNHPGKHEPSGSKNIPSETKSELHLEFPDACERNVVIGYYYRNVVRILNGTIGTAYDHGNVIKIIAN